MPLNAEAVMRFSDAEKDFSRLARMADEKGAVIITKNDVPRYVLMEYSQADTMRDAVDDEVLAVSSRLIEKNLEAYEELAK